MTCYTLSAITKTYGQRTVLRVQDLTIQRGEILGIIGPSGAGKSTLLRLLAFLETPTSGHLACHLDGTTLTPERINMGARRRLTMVFQEPMLLSRSVYHNVAYGLRIRGRHDKQRVRDMLADVGLSALMHAPARTLSGGEKQRVALARALILQPDVLLLDEPTANLDPHNIRILERCLRGAYGRYRPTIVIVTHNLAQARRLTQRTALLLDGELVEVNPTAAFFDNPTHPKTQAFLSGDYIY